MAYKPGDKVKFSGQIGHTRFGTIAKIWHDSDGIPWAHINTEPCYIWEKPQDLIFVVCLDGDHINHTKCIIHD